MHRRTSCATILVGLLIGLAPVLAVEPKPPSTKHEVKKLIASAATADDHRRLAAYYRQEARQLEAKAQDHQEMGDEYYKDPTRHPIPKYPTLGQHCRDLAGSYLLASKKATALANLHEQIVKEFAKPNGH